MKMKANRKVQLALLVVAFVAILSITVVYFKTSVYADPSTKFPSVCPLHGTSIKSKRVKAARSMSFLDYDFRPEEYYAAKKEFFPYSGTALWDGDYRGRWVRWIDKKYCPDCVAAERKWDNERAARNKEISKEP
jgi:hypothetical protein